MRKRNIDRNKIIRFGPELDNYKHSHWTERVISAARGCLSMMLSASQRYTALLSSAAARNMKVFLDRVPGGRVLKTTLF